MKRALILFSLLMAAAPAWAADPLTGMWRTQAGRDGGYGHVRITPCGDRLCGRLERSFDAGGVEVPGNSGALILDGVAATGDGAYGQGRIVNPENQRGYAAKLVLRGDLLEVAGCVMTICRTAGTWQRVD